MALSGLWRIKHKISFLLTQFGKKAWLPTYTYMLRQRLTRHGKKRAVFFPSRMNTGGAGDLRNTSIAAELKKFGWRVIVVPNWLGMEERQKTLKAENPHAVLLQNSVHELNRPWLYPAYNTVYDVDDADYVHEPELVARCCQTAAVSIAGNRHLAEVFRGYGSPHTEVVWTGTYVHSVPGAQPNDERAPIITWAHSRPHEFPVEAAFLMEVMIKLAASHKFIYRIYATSSSWTDEYLAPLIAAGVTVEIFGARRYRKFVQSLATAAIGLQPVAQENPFSMGKSFGKLLAYMAADVAVVASNTVDHPLFFRHRENGLLATTIEEWVEACGYLLDHPFERAAMTKVAHKDFLERLTTNAAAARISAIMDRFVPSTDK